MPRCDKCQHWKTPDEWEALESGLGRCLGVRERWKIADDASEGLPWSSDEEGDKYAMVRRKALQDARAYVEDGSEYHAALFTATDFFCALFKARSNA